MSTGTRVDASIYARSNCSVSPAAAEISGSFSGIPVVFIQTLKRGSVEGLKRRRFMAWWLVRGKRLPVVIVDWPGEATRRLQTVDPPSPWLRRAGWRPPLLAARLARARLRRALFALVA